MLSLFNYRSLHREAKTSDIYPIKINSLTALQYSIGYKVVSIKKVKYDVK